MSLNINNLIVTMAAELLSEEEAELDAELTAKWQIFNKRVKKTEDKLVPKLQAAFTKQEKSVLSRLKGKRIPDTSDAKIFAQIGDEVQYNQGVGVVEDMYITDGMRQPATVAVKVKIPTLMPTSREQYHYRTFRLCDIVLLKGSEEAEEAADKFVDTIYTASAWQATFMTAILPLAIEAYKAAGEAALAEIGIAGAFNVVNPAARKFLQERTFDNVKGINIETREKLRRALVQGFDRGESVQEISARIGKVFDINRGSRTLKISQTEILGASNNGTFRTYDESGIVKTKIWIDSRDSRVRHSHSIDGQERKLKERFSNGLLHPHDPGGPAEEVINCRCTIRAGKLKEAA